MVVIGIDFGNDSCVVSVWRNGRIDTVKNDFNDRYTPSMVAFSQRKRDFGLSAKKQWSNNVANTIFDFKNILNVNLTKRWKFSFLNFTENSKDSTLSFEISISGQKLKFTPCQILAMLLAKIRADTLIFLQSNEKTMECVIAVPSYFNDEERKAVLMAAAIARLDCQFCIKETTAVAISYSLHKKFLTPINVIFIDFGQSSIQISACKFNDRELEVIEEVSESIGGRDIDEALADYFINTCKIRGANKRSKIFCVQLLHQVEELKKKMSTNDERLQLNFKQLLNCEPILMERSEMEKVCAKLFEKIENLMHLMRSKLNIEEIHSIEMVGGSSRIPIVRKLVEKVFGKVPNSTMNHDDVVAQGSLLKYIMNIKRKGYKIKEKSLADNSCSYNPSCSGMKEHVRVFQVHRYLKCDCREAFNVTEDEFMDYVEIEKKLAKYDTDEVERREARNKLDTYLIEHMKPDGVLGNSNKEIMKELTDIRMWNDGTKDQYLDLLDYWTQKVEKIKNRKLMQQRGDKCVCVHRNTLTHQSDANQVLVKKLTFEGYSKASRFGRSQSPMQQSSKSRTHRKGLHFRHRRQNESQTTGLDNRQIGGSQNFLLNESKTKRRNWCCFL